MEQREAGDWKITQMSAGRALLTRYSDGRTELAADATADELRGLVFALLTEARIADREIPTDDRAELRDFQQMLATGRCPYCGLDTKPAAAPATRS